MIEIKFIKWEIKKIYKKLCDILDNTERLPWNNDLKLKICDKHTIWYVVFMGYLQDSCADYATHVKYIWINKWININSLLLPLSKKRKRTIFFTNI